MVTFIITKYSDNTYRIETKHMAYHFRDGLYYDNLTASQVIMAQEEITNIMNNKYNESCLFEIG